MSTSAQAHCLRAVLIRRAPDAQLPVAVPAPAHEAAACHYSACVPGTSGDEEG